MSKVVSNGLIIIVKEEFVESFFDMNGVAC